MRLKWIDICDRFLPLLINLIYIILISFNLKIDGFNILVNSNYFIATYIYLGLIIVNYLISIILHKTYYFKNRSFLFLLFIIIALSVCPKIGGYNYFSTFIFIYSVLDVLVLLFKMVYDSYYTEDRLRNLVLPPNQFNKSRRILSNILNYSGFVLFFIICFIVFYYNEAKVTSILILLLVGLVIVSINQIISMSVSVSPINKFIKKYEKDLNIKSFIYNLESLKETKLHNETLNLMNIILWKYYTFIDLSVAENYKKESFMPGFINNVKVYFDAYFYYLLVNKKYDMIITNERIFIKNVKNKKYVRAIIKTLHNNETKYRPKKNNKFDQILNDIYLDLSSKLTDFSNYNYIKFNYLELENTYKNILLRLDDYYTFNDFKDILNDYNTLSNKIIGATKISNIKLFISDSYYDDYKENINLLYNLYPLINNINDKIINSRFNTKLRGLYGPYYINHLKNKSVNNYDSIKEELIDTFVIPYDSNYDNNTIINKLVEKRNKIANMLGQNSYLDLLFNNKNVSAIDLINPLEYDNSYTINSNYDISNMNDKIYKEYLNYLKKHTLYSVRANNLNHTYYINNYRAPFIALNSNNLDYNQVYFELGKGYTYYLNSLAYIPAYLLDFSGYLNVVVATNSIDFINHEIIKYYNLYKELHYLYLNNVINMDYYKNIIVDDNPIDKLIACLMVKKLFMGNNNLLKIFNSLNRNLYKTSEKEIFGSLGLMDLYKYINKETN